MKRLKLNITALAVLIGVGTAFAGSHKHQSTVKWRPLYNNAGTITGWENVNGLIQGTDYTCDASSQACTAQFPSGVTPTASTPVPVDHVSGTFD
jgi:hypothetical protein